MRLFHLYWNNLYIGILFIIEKKKKNFYPFIAPFYVGRTTTKQVPVLTQPVVTGMTCQLVMSLRHVADDVRKRPSQTADTGDSFPKQELNFAENEPSR